MSLHAGQEKEISHVQIIIAKLTLERARCVSGIPCGIHVVSDTSSLTTPTVRLSQRLISDNTVFVLPQY